jgi:ferredoxin/flavodoxin
MTEIFYFSGTGNSLYAAKELQKRLPDTELTPILQAMGEDAHRPRGEAVGLIFPLYATTTPKIVDRFIKKLDPRDVRYLFAVATRGGTVCNAFIQIDKLLRPKGRQLDAYFILNMPGCSDPLMEDFPVKMSEDRLARLHAAVDRRMDSIEEVIADRKADRSEDLSAKGATPPPILRPFIPILDIIAPVLLPLGKIAESRFDFYADTDCNGCGVCEQVCLACKIKMVDKRPLWQRAVKCYGCFACLNFCPVHSVQVKSKWYLKSYTPVNGRYHHPAIGVRDIAAQKEKEVKENVK